MKRIATPFLLLFLALSPVAANASWLDLIVDILKIFKSADEAADIGKVGKADVVIGGVKLGNIAKKLASECLIGPESSKIQCEQRAKFFQECIDSGKEVAHCQKLYFSSGPDKKQAN